VRYGDNAGHHGLAGRPSLGFFAGAFLEGRAFAGFRTAGRLLASFAAFFFLAIENSGWLVRPQISALRRQPLP
jgi:hypothetical protein